MKFKGEEYYWEHIGRLNDKNYMAHWAKKEAWYNKHFPGKDIAYVDKLFSLGLIECESGKCKICGSNTNFKLKTTNDFVCCDKCKYEVLGIGEV